MTQFYILTAKAIEQGYTAEILSKYAADACRLLHYGDYSDLCVSTYATDETRGISVTSNDETTVRGFVENWLQLGLLDEVSPRR